MAQQTLERTPPQSIPAERAVLGAMLINTEAVAAAFEILRDTPGDLFYVDAHQKIFGAMTTLFTNRVKVDEVTVSEQLVRDGNLETAGGYTYLAELTGAAPVSSSVESYAEIVLENALLRKLITSCARIAEEAFVHQGEVRELLDSAESTIFAIAERRQLTSIVCVSELIEPTIKRIEELRKSGSHVTGLSTGFVELDALLSGMQPSDMIILAARPSVGKTALALNIARHAGVQLGKNVLLFSLEMSKEQLMQRLFCMQGKLDFRHLREGYLSQQEFETITSAADKLSRAPIYLDDTPNITVMDIRARARRHAAQHGVDLIVIDYLQLMSGSQRRSENRQVEIAEISRGVKGIARELHVPILALSQLSREADKDETGVPKLSHLRESGAIEQDADVVLMLSRPPREDEARIKAGFITLSVAKQRNGPTGNIELIFDGPHQQFKNVASPEHAPAPSPSGRPAAGPPPEEPPDIPDDREEDEPVEDEEVPF